MELTEMLRQWAELRPAQCQLTGFNIFTIAGKGICADFTYSYTGTYIYERELVFAWVQYAVQKAIVTRGWYFDLAYLPRKKEYHADVQVPERELQSAKAANPAEALLSAYLKALEGQPEAINPASSKVAGEEVLNDEQ